MTYTSALVTGGSGGVGRAVAQALTSAGIEVEVWGRDDVVSAVLYAATAPPSVSVDEILLTASSTGR